MQQVTIIGNLTRDPERVEARSGREYCKMTVAVNDASDRAAPATYWTVSAFGAQADACLRYLAKGRKVAVCGGGKFTAYISQDGEARVGCWLNASNVEFLGQPRRDDDGGEPHQMATGTSGRTYLTPPQAAPEPAQMQTRFTEVEDDDNPF